MPCHPSWPLFPQHYNIVLLIVFSSVELLVNSCIFISGLYATGKLKSYVCCLVHCQKLKETKSTLRECHGNQHVTQGGILARFMTVSVEKIEGMLQASQRRFYQWSCMAGTLPWAKMASVERCSKVVRTKLEVIASPSACSIIAHCTAFWGTTGSWGSQCYWL